MAIYKDGENWRAVYRYTDWTGERKQTQNKTNRYEKNKNK